MLRKVGRQSKDLKIRKGVVMFRGLHLLFGFPCPEAGGVPGLHVCLWIQLQSVGLVCARGDVSGAGDSVTLTASGIYRSTKIT